MVTDFEVRYGHGMNWDEDEQTRAVRIAAAVAAPGWRAKGRPIVEKIGPMQREYFQLVSQPIHERLEGVEPKKGGDDLEFLAYCLSFVSTSQWRHFVADVWRELPNVPVRAMTEAEP